MILIIIFLATAAYAGWMVGYFMRGKPSEIESPQIGKPPAEVIGRSKFVLDVGVLRPQAAKTAPTEPTAENAATFAPDNAPQHPRQIAPTELDAVFGEPPEGEMNEPLDIDEPLYDKPPFPGEDADDDDAENEELPLKIPRQAHGATFENLGEAYRQVVQNPNLTQQEQVQTGRLLLDLKPTDMFEYIVSGSPTWADKVQNLIDTYINVFNRRTQNDQTESQPPPSAPQGFSVLQYS